MKPVRQRTSGDSPRVLVDVQGRLGEYAGPLVAFTRQTLIESARELGLGRDHELSLVLCDNPFIRRINRRWRALDKPTDVLSFPLHDLHEGQLPPAGAIGDILVSLPYARRAARQLGVEFRAHLRLLLAHGLLHLLGYDHSSDAQQRRMQRMEARLLEAGR